MLFVFVTTAVFRMTGASEKKRYQISQSQIFEYEEIVKITDGLW